MAHDRELAASLQLMLAAEEFELGRKLMNEPTDMKPDDKMPWEEESEEGIDTNETKEPTNETKEPTNETEETKATMETEGNVKVEVKEEDKWEQTAWWEPEHEEDWYWEGVEEEEEEGDDDVAVAGSKPAVPPQPKKMPTNRDPPPPPPPLVPCLPPPQVGGTGAGGGAGGAEGLWKGPMGLQQGQGHQKRQARRGGLQAGTRTGGANGGRLLILFLKFLFVYVFRGMYHFGIVFGFRVGCTLFECFGNFLERSGREPGAGVLASTARVHSKGARSTGSRSSKGGKAWQKQSRS